MPNWSDGEYCDCPTGKTNGLSSPHRCGEPGCLTGPPPRTHPEYLKGMRTERRGVLLLIQRYKHTVPREVLPTLQLLENDIVAGAQGSSFPRGYSKHVDALFAGQPSIDELISRSSLGELPEGVEPVSDEVVKKVLERADELEAEAKKKFDATFDAETNDDLPDFEQIAQDTLDEYAGSITEPGVLAHELGMAYEAGASHTEAKYKFETPIGPMFQSGTRVEGLVSTKEDGGKLVATIVDTRTIRQVEVKYDNGYTSGWQEARFWVLADEQPGDPPERKVLRDKGLCGHITGEGLKLVACIQPIGHDDDVHERSK